MLCALKKRAMPPWEILISFVFSEKFRFFRTDGQNPIKLIKKHSESGFIFISVVIFLDFYQVEKLQIIFSISAFSAFWL